MRIYFPESRRKQANSLTLMAVANVFVALALLLQDLGPLWWLPWGCVVLAGVVLVTNLVSRVRARASGGLAVEITDEMLGYRPSPEAAWHELPLKRITGLEWKGPETIGLRTDEGSVEVVPFGFLAEEERTQLLRTVQRS